jgi:hypothetical protein
VAEIQQDAFLAWFLFKYDGEMTTENQVGFTLDVEGEKVVMFVTVWETMWSLACPIMRLDKSSKKSLFEIMTHHTDNSAMGLTLFDEMLCIVNCSTDPNPAETEDWITSFAEHAADLMKMA